MAHNDIQPVELCTYCGLPKCIHGRCINIGECPKATQCRCHVLFRPDFDYEQEPDVDSKAKERGRAGGLKRSRKRSAA